MTSMGRTTKLVLAVVLLAVAVTAYLVGARNRSAEQIEQRAQEASARIEQVATDNADTSEAPNPDSGDATDVITADGPALASGARMYSIHRVPGDDYGRIAVHGEGAERTLLDQRCARIHVTVSTLVCATESGEAQVLDAERPDAPPVLRFDVGYPSRIRISSDSRWLSTTGFLNGRSYADVSGDTRTLVQFHRTGTSEVFGMSEVTLDDSIQGAHPLTTQFWGVTFAGGDTFFVTAHIGGAPTILEGDLSTRALSATGLAGSCPSVSPDGKTLVYKQLRDDGGFDLIAVNRETDRRWTIGETRSVDDQVEWLDADTIVYALHPEGESDIQTQPVFDIWTIDIAEGSTPRLLAPAADSPAVVFSTP